jgi:hypothetical protein
MQVIVTRHSDWHAAFGRDETLQPHAADYHVYDPHTVSALGPVPRFLLLITDFTRSMLRSHYPSPAGATGATRNSAPVNGIWM